MELWLPWIEILGLAVIPFILFWLTFRLKVTQRGRLVMTARVISVVISLPILLFSLFLLTAQGCEEDHGLIGSPDGKHVARLMVWGSVPTGTSVRVILRKSWSPLWQVVSDGATVGTSLDPLEPRLSWIDNSRLIIDYPAPSAGTGFRCDSQKVGDILIVCRTHKGN
ncbi:MAG: hypothetical protein ABSA39_13370 [Edaphobacter sp.]